MKYISNPWNKWLTRLTVILITVMSLGLSYSFLKKGQYIGLLPLIIPIVSVYFISRDASVKYDENYIYVDMLKGTFRYNKSQLVEIAVANKSSNQYAIRFTDGKEYRFVRGQTRTTNHTDLRPYARKIEEKLRRYMKAPS